MKKLLLFLSFLITICTHNLLAQIVAITQITSHPALDQVHKGIVDELKARGYSGKIIDANAQGDISIQVQIAHNFKGQKPDVVVGISTPSAQALANVMNEEIPVVFATVTDPIEAKLVQSLAKPGRNITGTRNRASMKEQLELIKKVLPDVESVGIIINYSEQNSVKLAQDLEEEGKKMGVKIKVGPVTSSSEVHAVLNKMIHEVDALLLLQDNTVASALPSILSCALNNQIPLFSSYEEAVKDGALIGLAFDEYQIGRQTGKMVYKILQGEQAQGMPVEDPSHLRLVYNKATADKLCITLPGFVLKEGIAL